jgi:hypothetical protein
MLQHVRGKQHTKNTMYGAGGKSSGVDWQYNYNN